MYSFARVLREKCFSESLTCAVGIGVEEWNKFQLLSPNDNFKHKRGPRQKIKGSHKTETGQASTSNVQAQATCVTSCERANSAPLLTAPMTVDAPTETYATTLSYNFGVLDLAVALRLQQQAEIPDGR